MPWFNRFFATFCATIALLGALLFQSSGSADDSCSALFSPSRELDTLGAEHSLQLAAESKSPSIQTLGKLVTSALRIHDEAKIHASEKIALRLQLDQIVLELIQLIKLSEEGASEKDISEFAGEYIDTLRNSITRYFKMDIPPQVAQTQPKLNGAKYLDINQGVAPQRNLFVSNHANDYDKWMATLSQEHQHVILKHLLAVSATGHFGDIKMITHTPTGVHFFEMRFHQDGGARIYFLQVNENVVLLRFGMKSSQDRDIRLAGEAASAFLSS